MPSKILRAVFKAGDSKVVAIPPDWARMFKINIGDNVDLFYNSLIIIKPRGIKFDADFLRQEFDLILKLEEETR